MVTVSWPHSLAVLHSNGWPLGFPRNSYEQSGAPQGHKVVQQVMEIGGHSFLASQSSRSALKWLASWFSKELI